MTAIDELPTEAEREAARKIVEILAPLSAQERQELVRQLAIHFGWEPAAAGLESGWLASRK